MKIVIFGAGAVGGHVAAKLGAGAAQADIEVSAVARGAQLAAIRERGVTLWIGDERYDARLHATDRPSRIAQSDADLHEAVELVGPRGCIPDVAAQILL